MQAKRLLAASMAAIMALSLCACGKEEDESSHVDQVTLPPVEETEEIEKLPEGQNEITWMSHYDLNPGAGIDRSVALTLFEDVYGGKINYNQTTWGSRFDDLANAIMAARSPDIFPYEWLAIPQGISKEIYQPIDSIVDFTDPLWSDVKDDADHYAINGVHYIAPFYFDISHWFFYRKDEMIENGIDDPYQLYLEGNWNWDTFRQICDEWSALGEEYIPANGAFGSDLVQTTGQTMVINDGGVFIDNTDHPDIERAEAFLYDLAKDGLIYDTYLGETAAAFANATKIAFLGIGPWAGMNENTPGEDHGWGAVCIPLDPNTNEKICVPDMKAHMWVNGSTKDLAVKTWFECNRVAQTDEEYRNIDEQKFWANNPNWTEEMYAMYTEMCSSEFTKSFDFGYGVSTLIANTILPRFYESVYKSTDGVQNTYAQIRAEYQPVLQTELDAINEAMASLS